VWELEALAPPTRLPQVARRPLSAGHEWKDIRREVRGKKKEVQAKGGCMSCLSELETIFRTTRSFALNIKYYFEDHETKWAGTSASEMCGCFYNKLYGLFDPEVQLHEHYRRGDRKQHN
jgi:hypothetical protein